MCRPVSNICHRFPPAAPRSRLIIIVPSAKPRPHTGQWRNPYRPQNTISATRNQPGTASSTGSAIVPLLHSILKLDSRPRDRHDGLWTSTSGRGASAMARGGGSWSSRTGGGGGAWASAGGGQGGPWAVSSGGRGGLWKVASGGRHSLYPMSGRTWPAESGRGAGRHGFRWPAAGRGWGHTGHSSWPFNRSPGRKHGHRGWGLVWTSRKFDLLVGTLSLDW